MSWVPVPHVVGSCTAVYRETAVQEPLTHFGLYNVNKWRSVGGMTPGPVISIVCHVLAQSVCTDRDSTAPNRKISFPVFFLLRGPHWNL